MTWRDRRALDSMTSGSGGWLGIVLSRCALCRYDILRRLWLRLRVLIDGLLRRNVVLSTPRLSLRDVRLDIILRGHAILGILWFCHGAVHVPVVLRVGVGVRRSERTLKCCVLVLGHGEWYHRRWGFVLVLRAANLLELLSPSLRRTIVIVWRCRM